MTPNPLGEIVAIHGGVLDMRFEGRVPRVHELIRVGDVSIEVEALVGDGVVRGMALGSVKGLALGMSANATGAAIKRQSETDCLAECHRGLDISQR
ncbi:MAG: hypothetical protein RIC29_05970 [Rhodospirillaceae bacterium]